MLATIGVKSVLYVRPFSSRFIHETRESTLMTGRWVWCSRIPSSGVQALAQDAENDVFFNIMSLAFPVSSAPHAVR